MEMREAKCPFFQYVKRQNKRIVCEGITDRSCISQTYETMMDYERKFEFTCCKDYEKCRIYKLLMEKYADEEESTDKHV